jgi:two-component system cell cycle sensor histidine kinase/response regulator CckA
MAVILVVEDEEVVRVLAQSIFEEHGHQTLSAATVEQAETILKGDAAIDLLFTDLALFDDIQAGLALGQRAVELRPKLPVIYTSGQALTDGMRAMFVENSAFLPKPYVVDDLSTLAEKFGIKG